ASALISSVLCAFVGSAVGCSSSDGAVHGASITGDADSGASASSSDSGAVGTNDASVADAGSKLPCDRASQSQAAPTSLYDALVADLAALSGADRQTRANKFIADVKAAGGTPLQDAKKDRVVFVAQGAPANGTWSVGGSFRNADWTQNTLPMIAIAGTDLWAVDTTAMRGTEYAYKLLDGSDSSGFAEDPLSKNIVWDGINHNDVGFFNSLFFVEDGDATKGRLVRYGMVHSTKLADDRAVYVYLPPKYDDGSCSVLPHLLVQDGNESLTRGDFMSKADAEYAAHPDESAVLFFVALPNQNLRMAQYTFGDATTTGDQYGDFLRSDLEPKIAADYRLCANADDKGLSGASLGGLISTYLTFQHSEVWGYDGAQSASLFWDSNAMITRASAMPIVPVRFYFDNGIPDGTCASDDNCQPTRDMVAALQANSYPVTHVEVNDAVHDWPYWQARFPQMLAAFRAGRFSCKN
ncbi:MAG: alpha/beta hydrolase-fold protein, partial [Polyangiaceae bacterium]